MVSQEFRKTRTEIDKEVLKSTAYDVGSFRGRRRNLLPEKNEVTAKVEYKATDPSSAAVALTCPPPPTPLKALNNPGQQKQVKAIITTCTVGVLYHSLKLYDIFFKEV